MSYTKVLVPRSLATVSVLTPLFGWLFVPTIIDSLLIAGTNLGDVPVNFLLETSEDGAHPDDDRALLLTAQPGRQTSAEIGPRILRSYFRLSGQTDGPLYPSCAVAYLFGGIRNVVR